MRTEEVIAQMLTENTGRHMLDSGGAYGRHWERNQAAVAERSAVEVFEDEPVATWDYGPTLSVYHFLKNAVEFAPKLDRAFHLFVYGECGETRYINGTETVEEFIELLEKKGWVDPDAWPNVWVNTYNGEDALSQVLQYRTFQLTEECPWYEGNENAVLLSIHGGCDVRGGYTGFRAFTYWEDGVSLFDNARVVVYCNNVEGHRHVNANQMDFEGKTPSDLYYYADSDDGGYSWYSEYDEPVPNPEERNAPLCPYCGEELEVGGSCY